MFEVIICLTAKLSFCFKTFSINFRKFLNVKFVVTMFVLHIYQGEKLINFATTSHDYVLFIRLIEKFKLINFYI